MPHDARRPLAGLVALVVLRLTAGLLEGRGLGGAAVQAGVVAAVAAGPTRVLWRYRRASAWSETPLHHKVAVVTTDILSFAWLGPLLASFTESPYPPARASSDATGHVHPRQYQVETSLETIRKYRSEVAGRGGHKDIKKATTAFVALYVRDIGWPYFDDWASQVAALAFGLLPIAGGVAATAQLGIAVMDRARFDFVAILLVAAASQFLAGVTHVRDRISWHQVWMTLHACTILALGVHLTTVDIGFRSGVPDLAGRLAGFAFPLSLLVWQLCAFVDRRPGRKRCRRAAAATAALGVVWVLLNLADRLLAPPRGVEDLAAFIWPMCLVVSAILAAASPADWGVGSGPKALEDRAAA